MGTGTFNGAIQLGQKFLQLQKQLDSSGQATLTGHVQDTHRIWWPAWEVRAGDQIIFADVNDAKYRRIVNTSYEHSTVTNTLQLDAPPDSMQALLERLGARLGKYRG